MATEPKVKKMAQVVKDDGSVEFKFAHGAALAAKLDDFPQNVRDFFALIGMRTKLRNFTTPDEDAGPAGEAPEKMYDKLKAGIERLVKGELRVNRSGDEKAPTSTLVLEAALIYRKMKAVVQAQGPEILQAANFAELWQAQDTGDTIESLRPMVEQMDNTITNQAEIDEAVAKAQAARAEKGEAPLEGDDLQAVVDKATVTQLDQLKATAVFKLATGEAKKAREAAKQVALAKKAAEEMGASPL